MKWIDFTQPTTVDEAVGLLSENKGRARVMAGGTDLIVQLRGAPERLGNPDLIVDVKGIPELNELSYSGGSGLTLGAAVPCYKIYQNAEIAEAYPGFIDSAALIGGIQIQGRASIGGNLCNGTPSADSIPALIAHNVTCNIAGPNGTRSVTVEDFCTGPSKTVLEPDEILVSLSFPAPPDNFGARYVRFTPRNEMDIAVAGAGVSVTLQNGNISSARVALASVAPTPLLVKEISESLAGQPANEATINEAGKLAREAASPITDMRGTIEYRKHLCDVLTRRALQAAITRAQGGSIDA
ncbi:MAG: xanthine dehydrogenase family protein subunit M [SAR202 cluster bacterium]|nr:xanthine dehydrogenase family protein subunit M [SAR202 cluster bacterium]